MEIPPWLKQKPTLLEEEFTPEEKEGYLNHLRHVGPQKPLGYLPLKTIERCDSSKNAMIEESMKRGLRTLYIPESQGRITSGAPYIYDEQALQELLLKNQRILNQYRWPTIASEFVTYVATKDAPGNTPR